ncbi:hypothetical protein GCM10010309_02550 [Streptomyces violaceochromogenes]|nr:hypothetical protein GCM10010309_02550 [Streptomyces violaceochromogenes]
MVRARPGVILARRAKSGPTEGNGTVMHAQLGHLLIVESPATGTARRDGEIVGLHHDDGTPPYDVRWWTRAITRLVELRGGDQDLPPGQGHALLHPRLRELSQEEYRTLLPTHGVGAFL